MSESHLPALCPSSAAFSACQPPSLVCWLTQVAFHSPNLSTMPPLHSHQTCPPWLLLSYCATYQLLSCCEKPFSNSSSRHQPPPPPRLKFPAHSKRASLPRPRLPPDGSPALNHMPQHCPPPSPELSMPLPYWLRYPTQL